MRNVVLVLISILMLVHGILAIVSSGYDYAAERLFYRAMKANSKIAGSSHTNLPRLMSYVEKNLNKLVYKYSKAQTAKQAHFVLAEFYLNNNRHEQALSTLYDIINTYKQDASLLAKAHFLRGVAFERQDEWEKALREYKIVRDKYTDTPTALRIPLYIADYYEQQNDYAQADKAYNEAIGFYRKIERRNRGQAAGYAAANLLIRAYLELEQYEQAGEVVEETIHLYPKLLPLAQQLGNIDLIFIKKLNKPDKAIQLLKNMRDRTENPQLIDILDEKIKALEAQK